MSTTAAPRAPRGLERSGRRLWRSIVDVYELDVHEQLMLVEACRVADRLDRLADAAALADLTVTNSKGDEVASPFLVEARQQAVVFSRLLASLRLPTGDEDDVSRPQRRGGARGAYGVRSVS